MEFSLKSGGSMLKFQASSDTWQKVFRHYSIGQDVKTQTRLKKQPSSFLVPVLTKDWKSALRSFIFVNTCLAGGPYLLKQESS
ncbi:hypothetical protein MID00_14600 [Alcaligenes sp. NLF5-7]|uniref:hypothetical protein n=1 Tax=Alcaligenes sp. NLF5-7 TaxID=2918755 RepID=UPI0020C1DEAC|nr:hypothetical protein [Alcaligenes sp. NLF5-7]UTM00720.1 hypothetical protein MID00_14600 [Alcaligenes sp. NLF5-7]